MEFLSPGRLWFLLLIPAFVAVYLFMQHRRTQYALRFTNIALLDRVAPRRPQWRRHVAVALALVQHLAGVVRRHRQHRRTADDGPGHGAPVDRQPGARRVHRDR